ncbi:Cell division protein ZapA, partial [Dysosmobacter welbionis]
QTVHDQGGQSLALHVLRDDQQLLAGLDDLLQDGQDVSDDGDLLVGNQDIGIVQVGLHLLHVGGHVGGDIAPVKLHALHDLGIGVGGLGLLNGDDAVGRDLLHGVGDQLADLLVA